MSLIDDIKKMLSKKIAKISFIDTTIFILGIGIVCWGIIRNELSWVPTGFLLIEKVKPKKDTESK